MFGDGRAAALRSKPVAITVIATGFERKAAARPGPNAASTTPVDLSSYTQHLSRAAAADAAAAAQSRSRSAGAAEAVAPGAPAAAAASGMAPSLSVGRRPGIELSLNAPAVAAGAGAAEESAIEHSLFDVPAFLRRQN